MTHKGFRLDFTNCDHIPKPNKNTIATCVEQLIYKTFVGTKKIMESHYPFIKNRCGYNAIQMEYNTKEQRWVASEFFIE